MCSGRRWLHSRPLWLAAATHLEVEAVADGVEAHIVLEQQAVGAVDGEAAVERPVNPVGAMSGLLSHRGKTVHRGKRTAGCASHKLQK